MGGSNPARPYFLFLWSNHLTYQKLLWKYNNEMSLRDLLFIKKILECLLMYLTSWYCRIDQCHVRYLYSWYFFWWNHPNASNLNNLRFQDKFRSPKRWKGKMPEWTNAGVQNVRVDTYRVYGTNIGVDILCSKMQESLK